MYPIRRRIAQSVYYGWVIVFVCLLASLVVFGTSYAFGVFFDSFIREFERSQAVISVAFGLQTASLFGGAVVAGRFIDRYGRRRITAIGGSLFVAGLVWTALAESYVELLLAFGVVTALGMAILYVVGYATVPVWFTRRRGVAGGIAASGLGVGLVVVPSGASLLIETVGWRRALLVVAAVVAVFSLVIAVLVADRPADIDATDARAAGTTGSSDISSGELLDTIGSGSFLIVFLGWVLIFASLYVVLGYIVLYATEVGFGRRVGVLAITVLGISTTVTRIGVGLLSDYVGRVVTFVVCAAILGGSTALIPAAGSALLLFAVVTLFGVGYGGCGGLLGPFVADVFGNDGLNTLFSVMSLSFGIAGILAPPYAGFVFETIGAYDVAFVSVGLGSVLGAGLVFVGTRYRSGD
ncbi:MAG: MFS transporter [Natronomonas sp.]